MTNPDSWGISDGFWDVSGSWHDADPLAVQAAMVSMAADGEPPAATMVTVRLDHQLPPVAPGILVLEDGTEVKVERDLPPDTPAGYHRMQPHDGDGFPLVVSPGRVPLPGERLWGFSAQLYAARSTRSWGIGDLADLRRLGEWSSGLGAGMVLINPLHAASPTYPQQASPYYAGSRCFVNPIYISVDDVPEAAGTDEIAQLGTTARALCSERLIDRDKVWSLKNAALQVAFERFAGDVSFDAFLVERGQALTSFAAFCALTEIHGSSWRRWPPELARPDSRAVGDFVSSPQGSRRVRYFAWLQWLLARQFAQAAGPVGVVQDLAVGVDPDGPDSWIWQDCFASGMRVGAPPDEFNTQGQDWGLHPFDPWRLRAGGYEPWIQALRAGMAGGGGLRVDHVMGLFRLYWIPDGQAASSGVYVRYPHHDLLNILALEAYRAGAFVVGEDLGTVEDQVRRDLAERQVMSYRVWWFEEARCDSWPPVAMGAVTTHDLPTVAGVVTGSDLEAQRELGLAPNEGASARLLGKVLERSGCDEDSPVEEVIGRVYEDLAEAPCRVLTATLEDGLGLVERPNMPGTVDEWPNWSLALPRPIEDFPQVKLFDTVARALNRF